MESYFEDIGHRRFGGKNEVNPTGQSFRSCVRASGRGEAARAGESCDAFVVGQNLGQMIPSPVQRWPAVFFSRPAVPRCSCPVVVPWLSRGCPVVVQWLCLRRRAEFKPNVSVARPAVAGCIFFPSSGAAP